MTADQRRLIFSILDRRDSRDALNALGLAMADEFTTRAIKNVIDRRHDDAFRDAVLTEFLSNLSEKLEQALGDFV
jgi:hypothetical protein